jgi:hypothetical protein
MATFLDDLAPGQPIEAPAPLVPKISDDQVAAWKEKFSGGAA